MLRSRRSGREGHEILREQLLISLARHPLAVFKAEGVPSQAFMAHSGTERIVHAVHASWPDVHCFRCLAARLGATEPAVRDEAQVLIVRNPNLFMLERRVCSSCQRPGQWLVERDPLATALHGSPCIVRRVAL